MDRTILVRRLWAKLTALVANSIKLAIYRTFAVGPMKKRFFSFFLYLKYKNRDKCGKIGLNPSAKNGPVHFLLGAMLPCSTPFSTSAYMVNFKLHLSLLSRVGWVGGGGWVIIKLKANLSSTARWV